MVVQGAEQSRVEVEAYTPASQIRGSIAHSVISASKQRASEVRSGNVPMSSDADKS